MSRKKVSILCSHTFEALDMAIRYFTDRCDINGDAPISFGTEIDPHNILTKVPKMSTSNREPKQ